MSAFLSTLSLRRATCYSLRHSASCRHFYPRSPCGERQFYNAQCPKVAIISIHALLAESDADTQLQQAIAAISIHALLAESDPRKGRASVSQRKFLSTLSLRRATQRQIEFERYSDISIHALLAESDTEIWPVIAEITISIHALLAESDCGRIRQSLPR